MMNQTYSPINTAASLQVELQNASAGLADNDDVLRSVLAGCGDCIKILDLDGTLRFMSEGGKRVMEVTDFSVLKGCPWPDFWTDAGHFEAKRAVETAKAGGTGRFQGPAKTAKGNDRYWDVQVSPIVDGDGKPTHLLSISRDVTEEHRAAADAKEAADRQALLTAELQHRIKNTLAMVGAIANQTMRGDSVSAAREAFSARLITLSHAHDILTKTSWASAPIREVVEGALAPHRTGNGLFSIVGLNFDLIPKQALALSVAIHELATNAVKYGSLSRDGKVAIEWTSELLDGAPTFRFNWTESGGPTVIEPSQEKRGFGSRLIQRMLPNDFGGTVTVFYKPQGLVCELLSPLDRLNVV